MPIIICNGGIQNGKKICYCGIFHTFFFFLFSILNTSLSQLCSMKTLTTVFIAHLADWPMCWWSIDLVYTTSTSTSTTTFNLPFYWMSREVISLVLVFLIAPCNMLPLVLANLGSVKICQIWMTKSLSNCSQI